MPRRMSALDRAIDTVARLKSPALMRAGIDHMRTAQAAHDLKNTYVRDVLAAMKAGGPDEARRVHAEYEQRLVALEQETARLIALEANLFDARARAFATVREWARARA